MKDVSQIHYANVAEALIEAVPELRARYAEELRVWGDELPGPHIIFGDVLNPYLIELLDAHHATEQLQKVFEFLEILAHHDDVHVQELVAVTVCERLGDCRELLQKARKFMGPRTRQFSKEVEDFWGRKR
jgi:hypothetical protein